MRQLMHRLADEGRTIFVSSHLLSEMALTTQELVVIGRGRPVRQSTTEQLIDQATDSTVRVRGPQPERLRAILRDAGFTVRNDHDALIVSGATSQQIGELAATRAPSCTS
jgi:ABC-2 type transport system ATP-binding protein